MQTRVELLARELDINITSVITINSENIYVGDIPFNSRGVYLFTATSSKLSIKNTKRYIGVSINLQSRLTDQIRHFNKHYFIRRIDIHICKTADDARYLESQSIIRLKPELNIVVPHYNRGMDIVKRKLLKISKTIHNESFDMRCVTIRHGDWNIGIGNNFEYAYLIIYCLDKYMRNILRVYIIPRNELIKRQTITIYENATRNGGGWYSEYRVNEKQYNDLYQCIKN